MSHSDQILMSAEQCTGCLRCVLACSFFTSSEKAFNPLQSKIKVVPSEEDWQFKVTISNDCDLCGICVDY